MDYRCYHCNERTSMMGHPNGCPSKEKPMPPKRASRLELQNMMKELDSLWDKLWLARYADAEFVEFQSADVKAFNEAMQALKSKLK